ncbi:MAG: CHAT domain-containing tetratricopeptide repeat protein [Gemmatimonadota bacterium]|nr:CHAT domain-containing tetratricopeptide repeat protein [Gemmatimonadota bacterium]
MKQSQVTAIIAAAVVLACSESPDGRGVAGGVTPKVLTAADLARRNQIDPMVARGESAYAGGAIDSARAVWTLALAESRAVADPPSEARILTWLGLAAYRLGDYAESRSLGERALALKQQHGVSSDLFKSYNALGLLAWNEGRLSDAILLYQKATDVARAARDDVSLAKAANNVGLVHAEFGNFAKARLGFEEAYRAGTSLHDTLIQGRALTNLGMLDVETGDPGSAITKLIRARALSRAVGDPTGEQNTMGQMGSAYNRMGEPGLALAAMDSALLLSRRQGLKQEEASNLELIAGLHREAGRLKQALRLYAAANAINREVGLNVERGSNLRSSAEIQALLGRGDLAKANATAALEIHRSTGARVQEIRDLLLLADLESSHGGSAPVASGWLDAADRISKTLGARTARAEVALGKAVIAERAGSSREVLATLRSARADMSAGGYRTEWAASAMMARAYAGLSQLDSAAVEGGRAIAAVERVRGKFGSGLLRTSFLADKSVPYADLVDVLLRLGRTSEAFEVADAARSRALLENAATTSRDGGAGGATIRALGAGESILRRIDVLISLLDGIDETPPSERNTETAARAISLTAELSAARSSYEALMVRVSERDAAGSAMLGTRTVSIAEVQRALGPDEALVEFLLAPERLVVFVVTKASIRSVSQGVSRTDIERRVRIALDLLGKRTTPASTSGDVLAGLRSALIGPAEGTGLLKNVRRLIIVPHGALSYVPFAALRDGRAGRYLIEDYSLTYLPSAAAVAVLRGKPPSLRDMPVAMQPLAFAPFSSELPGSAREARAFTRAIRGGTSVVGAAATERQLRNALERSGIVHIATHGVMNPRNPMFSRVEMARGSGAVDDDGRLEVHEVLGLRLAARLVFLSGCETALGIESNQAAAGEDYATLAQAFLYAGASSVAATLWRIGDDGAAEFAARFYSRLTGMAAPEALAAAQRELIREKRFRNPYYWAAYQIGGADEIRQQPAKSD